MTLGCEFAGIMDHADIAAEKCGDVVEIWLGPTKKTYFVHGHTR